MDINKMAATKRNSAPEDHVLTPSPPPPCKPPSPPPPFYEQKRQLQLLRLSSTFSTLSMACATLLQSTFT
ncbi:unnamed protein product [Brassica napus]|uniref:(rape) hypothetical protein n=1 Tax=Brassica napus TaxID=3708 RepID=A0A816SE05_BRANA|nr:unnamed protein product [Brassica napus]